jgi:N-dimethylarginine dimethylaminohydrolase
MAKAQRFRADGWCDTLDKLLIPRFFVTPVSLDYDQHLFPGGRWLLCPAAFFDVKYEINPWMSIAHTPQHTRARRQWQTLHHTLLRLGAWVEYVEPHRDCPDMVFTANAGLNRGKQVVLSRFRHKERQLEAPYFKQWFEDHGYHVVEVHSGSFEGEGDALFAAEKLFCGWGFRSDREAYAEVQQALSIKELVYCRLVDPRFYHLDTCFCPLDSKRALFYPPAFDEESKKSMESHIELFPVTAEDAARFACNAVVLGRSVVLPSGCAETQNTLRKLGYESHPVELDEFLKAGGSAKCLTMRISHAA